MSIIQLLEDKLIGNFYSRLSIGDTFDLFFNDFWLVAHSIEYKDISSVKTSLSKCLPLEMAVDPDIASIGAVLSVTLREKIKSISLRSDSTLELTFENKVILNISSKVDIVDWQWALNKTGGDPYLEHIICCFESGDVQIGS